MSLEVKEMVLAEKMKHSECILCGECIDCCPKQAIEYTFIPSKISRKNTEALN
jgi:polyferredoxin